MEKIIYVNNYLSSAEYYKAVLPEVQMIMRYHDKIECVVFDFSGTSKIEPNWSYVKI